MTLINLFNFAIQEGECGRIVRVQRGLAIENDALSWCLGHDNESGSTIDVPYSVWRWHDRVIGVWAPQLKLVVAAGREAAQTVPEEALRRWALRW